MSYFFYSIRKCIFSYLGKYFYKLQTRHLCIVHIALINTARVLILRSLLTVMISFKTNTFLYLKQYFPKINFLSSLKKKRHLSNTLNSSPISPLSQTLQSVSMFDNRQCCITIYKFHKRCGRKAGRFFIYI